MCLSATSGSRAEEGIVGEGRQREHEAEAEAEAAAIALPLPRHQKRQAYKRPTTTLSSSTAARGSARGPRQGTILEALATSERGTQQPGPCTSRQSGVKRDKPEQ